MDDEILIDGGAPARIPEGMYDAVVTRIRKETHFHRQVLNMRFRIVGVGPYEKTELDGWFPLGEGGKIKPRSKLVRSYQAIGDWARPDRVRFKTFKEHLLQVRVQTVQQDQHQRPLLECQQYSVVAEVVGTQGKLGPRSHDSSD